MNVKSRKMFCLIFIIAVFIVTFFSGRYSLVLTIDFSIAFGLVLGSISYFIFIEKTAFVLAFLKSFWLIVLSFALVIFSGLIETVMHASH